MSRAEKDYLIEQKFIVFVDFKLSMFLNVCIKRDELYGLDDDNFEAIVKDKGNLTETGLKFYNEDLKIMYKDFETNYLRQNRK